MTIGKFFTRLALAAALVISAGMGVANAADADKGAKLFKAKCGICHATEAGKRKVGPTLHAVVGRKAAGEKFKYSKALKGADLTWDEATLDKWIANPKDLVKGNKMSFPGIKDDGQRADIIAYLKTVK